MPTKKATAEEPEVDYPQAIVCPTISESKRRVAEELAKPFPPHILNVRPGNVSNGRALMLWYIDARAAMQRLDDVFGIGNWSHRTYFPFPDVPMAITTITVACEELEIYCHHDGVGEASKEEELGKSSDSDALKRAAVAYGIGRYLYDMPPLRWPYDEKHKTFANPELLQEFMAYVVRMLENERSDAYGDVTRLDREHLQGWINDHFKWEGQKQPEKQPEKENPKYSKSPEGEKPKPEQKAYYLPDGDEATCPECGRPMKKKLSRNGNPFWGCTGYNPSNPEEHCACMAYISKNDQ